MKTSDLIILVRELSRLDSARLPHEPKQRKCIEIETVLQKENLMDADGGFIYVKENHPNYAITIELMQHLEL